MVVLRCIVCYLNPYFVFFYSIVNFVSEYWFILYFIVINGTYYKRPKNNLYCFMLFCFVLCCFVLFYVFLYCFVLFCVVLCCFVLFYVVLYCSMLFCNVLSCFVLFYVVLYCSMLFFNVLCCFVLYSIVFFVLHTSGSKKVIFNIFYCTRLYYIVLRCTVVYKTLTFLCETSVSFLHSADVEAAADVSKPPFQRGRRAVVAAKKCLIRKAMECLQWETCG